MLTKFKDINVLVLGDIVLDRYTKGQVRRISPEAPVPVLLAEEEFCRLGGAANVAANVMSLTGNSTLIGFVGKDDSGHTVMRECGLKGIRLRAVEFLFPTIVKNRFITDKQQLLRVDFEKIPSPEVVRKHDNARKRAIDETIDKVDVVVVSDYGKGFVDKALMLNLRSSGKTIVVDPIPKNVHLYADASVVKPNEKEAVEMCHFLGFASEVSDAQSAAKTLCDWYDGPSVVVTCGERGMVVAEKGKPIRTIETTPREVYDVTGAGDSVTATMALCLAAGADIGTACECANAAGGVVVGHIGSVAVTLAELQEAYHG